MKELAKALAVIQQKLVAPKGEVNTFAKFSYRTTEGILEAVKPLLGDYVLLINDDLIERGGRTYIQATATFTDGKDTLRSTSFAAEEIGKKGMSPGQITGTASSYARKYALSGLFAIDGNDDIDSMDNSKAQDDARHAAQADCKIISNAVNSSEAYFKLSQHAQGAAWGMMIDSLKTKINKGL